MALFVDVCGSCGVIEESSPLRGRFDSPLIRDFREPARRSYRTIDRVGPSVRDFASQYEIIVWCVATCCCYFPFPSRRFLFLQPPYGEMGANLVLLYFSAIQRIISE